MFREIVHFFRYAPGVVRMSRGMSQAEIFDTLMESAEAAGFAERRAALVEGLAGEVLEIGCGTGRMFPFYRETVRLTAIEPAAEFLDVAAARVAGARAEIALKTGDAMDLPFADGAFDAVVVANVLCSVPSIDRTLAEVRRVLKPGGEARLVEHVRSEKAVAGLLMHVFNPCWRLWNRQGCNMNRRIETPLRAAGFTLEKVERFQIFCPGLPAFPSLQISAQR